MKPFTSLQVHHNPNCTAERKQGSEFSQKENTVCKGKKIGCEGIASPLFFLVSIASLSFQLLPVWEKLNNNNDVFPVFVAFAALKDLPSNFRLLKYQERLKKTDEVFKLWKRLENASK
jgi:hypothetical protein